MPGSLILLNMCKPIIRKLEQRLSTDKACVAAFGRGFHNRNVGTSGQLSGIRCRLMVPDDEAAIKSQLYEGYFREEPISKALNFDIPRECRHLVDAIVIDAVKDDVTVVAMDDKHAAKIAGVIVSRLVTPHNDRMPICSPADPDNRKMCIKLGIWEKLHEDVDLFEKYNYPLALHLVFASVKPEYSHGGLLDAMVRFGGKVGMRKGAYLIYAEASSLYSTQAAVKLGFDVVKRIPLANYTDIDVGETIADNTGVHTDCALVACIANPNW